MMSGNVSLSKCQYVVYLQLNMGPQDFSIHLR